MPVTPQPLPGWIQAPDSNLINMSRVIRIQITPTQVTFHFEGSTPSEVFTDRSFCAAMSQWASSFPELTGFLESEGQHGLAPDSRKEAL